MITIQEICGVLFIVEHKKTSSYRRFPMPESDGIWSGNAFDAGQKTGQWFFGPFMPEGSLLKQDNIQIKLHRAKAGTQRSREEASLDPEHASVAILFSGNVTYYFATGEVTLVKQGDAVLWGKGTLHWWCVHEDSLIQTIRVGNLVATID